jgi:hypothetical protein
MDHYLGLTKVVKEFIAQTLAHVRIGYQTGNIDDLYRYKPGPIMAFAVSRVAGNPHFLMRAFGADVGNTAVRIYCGERIGGYLGIRKSYAVEKSRFAHVRFTHKSDLQKITSLRGRLILEN